MSDPSVYSCCELGAAREAYAASVSTPLSPALAALDARTAAVLRQAHMVSGALAAATLRLLVKVSASVRALEIGTYTGFSAIAIAEALPEGGTITTVDSFVDEIEAKPIFRDAVASLPERTARKIVPVEADADAYLAELAGRVKSGTVQPFDFVFLDADKMRQLAQFELMVESGIVRAGGLVVVDNTLWYSRVVRGEGDATTRAVDGFNKAVAADERAEVVQLPMRDGLTVIRVVGAA
eukprot:CAMPEP_0174900458 /NCGR_PEP_ID=MMETSP0167-20121228/31328_1 /TAXON_ID=38298 /ORGANISM="Rhodella maculata, Strain CCMP736" /LENGTH=237 /DNA_ID=CAMNT_0016141839 /DNA_START=53 /DNA_END=763 /DNA_ORIENTATION=-